MNEQQKRRLSAYDEVFSTDAGKFLLKDLKTLVGYDKSPFVYNPSSHKYDPLEAAINSGAQKVIFYINDILNQIQTEKTKKLI